MLTRHPANIACQAAAALLACLALTGCGAGASSYNVDNGTSTDGYGNKVITRTLENAAGMDVSVELWLNNADFIDSMIVHDGNTITVEIDNMDPSDSVTYRAQFEDGSTVSGSFDQDGRTVFTYTTSSDRGAPMASARDRSGAAYVDRSAPTRKARSPRKNAGSVT